MYKFYYAVGASCMGGLETLPLSAGGSEHEERPEPITGLTLNTEYTVCVVAEDLQGTAISKGVHFKTALPPEKPVGEEVSGDHRDDSDGEGRVEPKQRERTGLQRE